MSRRLALLTWLQGQVVLSAESLHQTQGPIVHPAVAVTKRFAIALENRAKGFKSQLDALIDPWLVSVIHDPALAVAVPAVVVGMEPDLVMMELHFLHESRISLDHPMRGAISL